MTDFYVYVHRKATTGEIFYVGKGKDDRAYVFGRNRYWDNTAKKHGYTVETIETGLQEWYALELEINLIAYHGRRDLKLGPLVNMTDGGEGMSGFKFNQESKDKMGAANRGRIRSEETKSKLSKLSTGNKNSLGHKHSEETKTVLSKINIGKTHSEETKQKISELFSGEKHPMFGKTHTPEAILKITEANTIEKRKKLAELAVERFKDQIGVNHPMFGKKHSDESRKKMSESAKRRWAK